MKIPLNWLNFYKECVTEIVRILSLVFVLFLFSLVSYASDHFGPFEIESDEQAANCRRSARYGGTIVNPDGIQPDISIKIRLNNDVTIKEKTFTGLKNPESIKLYTKQLKFKYVYLSWKAICPNTH